MLCCRRISAIGTPASPCFRMPTIWLSVNRDFRMGISLAPESLPSNGLPGGEAYSPAGVGGESAEGLVLVVEQVVDAGEHLEAAPAARQAPVHDPVCRQRTLGVGLVPAEEL